MPRSGSSWDESVCRVPKETSLRTLASIRSWSIAARIARSSRSGSWGRLPRPGPSGQSSAGVGGRGGAERQGGDPGAEAGRAGEEAASGGAGLAEVRDVVSHPSIPTPSGADVNPRAGGAALGSAGLAVVVGLTVVAVVVAVLVARGAGRELPGHAALLELLAAGELAVPAVAARPKPPRSPSSPPALTAPRAAPPTPPRITDASATPATARIPSTRSRNRGARAAGSRPAPYGVGRAGTAAALGRGGLAGGLGGLARLRGRCCWYSGGRSFLFSSLMPPRFTPEPVRTLCTSHSHPEHRRPDAAAFTGRAQESDRLAESEHETVDPWTH